MDDDNVTINFGNVRIDASDFKIDNSVKPQSIPKHDAEVKYTFDLSEEQVNSFKKIIFNKYGWNIDRCMACEYCTIILDDTGMLKDLECKLGAGKLAMISNTDCLLPYGG